MESSKYKYCVAILLFVWHAQCCTNATTVITLVTPTGIVMGADGKTLSSNRGTLSSGPTVVKVFLLKGRFAVADVRLQRHISPDGKTILYDFPSWIKGINKNVNAKMSVGDLTDIIEKQAPIAFAFLIRRIEIGAFTKDEAIKDGFVHTLVEFVIAGYDGGVPTVYSVLLEPDWERKIVTPRKVLIHPVKGQSLDLNVLLATGQSSGIDRAVQANTEEYKKLSKKLPVELPLWRDQKPFSNNQASNVVRALISIQSETTPEDVGFPVTVVTVPNRGYGSVRTYETDFSPLPCLPKSNGKARKKQENQQH